MVMIDLMVGVVTEGRRGAPVIMASLAAEAPLVTTPSEGTLEPGATATATPTPTDDAGTCSPARASRPGLSTSGCWTARGAGWPKHASLDWHGQNIPKEFEALLCSAKQSVDQI